MGYFRRSTDDIKDRPKSLFTFSGLKSRSSVLQYPRGTPYRDPSAQGAQLQIRSVWNIDMLLSIFSTCLMPGDTLVDMFAGTGSASIAALLRGCHTIIVERSTAHLTLCQKRMNAHINKVKVNLEKYFKFPMDQVEDVKMSEVCVYISITSVEHNTSIYLYMYS